MTRSVEFIEDVPIIDYVRHLVVETTTTDLKYDEKYAIIDLACGRGYLSMILSECLPPTKVEPFVLVDKGWPRHGTIPGPQHLSWENIYGIHPSSISLSSNEEEEEEEGKYRSNGDGEIDTNVTTATTSSWSLRLQ